jgi:hypothetical protein
MLNEGRQHMAKFFLTLSVAWLIGWVLFDAETANLVQMGTAAVYGLVRFVPGKAWLAIGEFCAEMMPWLLIANLDI